MRGIPCQPLRDVVAEFIAGYDVERDGWDLLADRMGYADARSASSTIPRVLAGEFAEAPRHRPGFDLVGWVDRLLVAVDAPHLAHLIDIDAAGRDLATDEEHDATCGECGRIIDWSDPAALAVRIELSQVVSVRRRWSWWSLCALCFAESGLHPPPSGRIPGDVLLDLYRSYVTEKVGIGYLAEDRRLPERYGFRSTKSAAAAVRSAWVRCAWPVYDSSTALRLNRKARLSRSGYATLRISAAQARVLHAVYERDGVGITLLADRLYERLGFQTSSACASSIRVAFIELGLHVRSRAESQLRRGAAARSNGFGGRGYSRRLTVEMVERLWSLYQSGHSSHEIARRYYERLGYPSWDKLRNGLEYAWKRLGHELRSNREAELLSRARNMNRCAAMKTDSDGRRPRPCTQRPLAGEEFRLHHHPDHQEAVRARADALRACKRVHPKVAWSLVRPHLDPLLEPRPDPCGRKRVYETASGALARRTGVDPAIASRLLKHEPDEITVRRANQLLAPLGLTVETLPELALPLAA